MSKETAEALMSKFKTKKVFKHLVDAAAGSKNIEVHKTIYKVLAKNKNKDLLGKIANFKILWLDFLSFRKVCDGSWLRSTIQGNFL